MKINEILNEMYAKDEEDYDKLPPEDRWLAKYTYQNLDKWPSREIINKLLKKYPSQPGKIYRGMNFATKEQFDEFMGKIQDGKLEIGGISSWTDTPEAAKQFALTRPSYFLDLSTMTAHDEAMKSGEEVSGYRGVIISTHIHAGQGIDVNKSDLGHESEVILPPGTYPVEVQQIKKYAHQIADNETTVDKMVLGAKSLSDKHLQYVLASHKDELSPAARKHIFKLCKPSKVLSFEDKPSYSSPFSEKYPLAFGGQEFKYVDVDVAGYLIGYSDGVFLPEDVKKVKALFKQQMIPLISYVQANPGAVFVGASVPKLAQFAGIWQKLQPVWNKHVSKQYNEIQNYIREALKKQHSEYRVLNWYKDKLTDIVKQAT